MVHHHSPPQHTRSSCQIMPKLSFTDLSVRALRPGVYFDTKTPAFGIRVGKNRRTWIVLKGARSTKVRLGHYPALSLMEARRRALIALGSSYAPSTAPTFVEALNQFLSLDRWKPRSKYEIERTLRRHFQWQKTLDKITHRDVATVIDGITAKHEAAHALKDIKTFFSWCVPRFIPHSPCAGLRAPVRYVPRTRLLTDDEIAKIWHAAELMEGYGRHVQLLIVTGQRANQIIKLRPEWISRDKRLLSFPPSVMKSNRAHVLPYGHLTARLLSDSSSRPTSYQGKKKHELDALSGISGYVLHDFRRYYSSTQARLKTPIDCTEAILSHRTGSRSQIQQVYDQYDRLEEKRQAVELFEAHLTTVLQPPLA
jgi:integrase